MLKGQDLFFRYHLKGPWILNDLNIKIQPEERRVFVHERQLLLTKKEYDLLLYLISNNKQVVTKETIAEHLWGSQIDLLDSFEFIYSHVKNLRKKLLNKGAKDYIQTVYGIGYRLVDK